MQRGLRLRAGGDGQLGVLRQPDAASAAELVDDLRAGEPVEPTRGAVAVCTFKEVARVLAGFPTTAWPTRACGAGPPRWPGCGSPRQSSRRAPGDDAPDGAGQRRPPATLAR